MRQSNQRSLRNIPIILFTILGFIFYSCSPVSKNEVFDEESIIVIIDDQALEVLDPTAELEKLSCGYSWTEGPLWVEISLIRVEKQLPI
jgi:hypothetical protein